MQDLLTDALAVYRLTHLVVEDEFPPIRKARVAFLRRYDDATWQAQLIQCPWCIGFWIAAGVVVARRLRLWRPAATALALSAATGILSER